MKGAEEQGAGSRGQGRKTNDDTFENLEIWQEAIELAARVYQLFRDCRDFGFRGQFQEAAASVPYHIAEGHECDSKQELIRFCIIAKGSCGEVRSQAYLTRRVELLSEANAVDLVDRAKRLSKRIARFVEVRRKKDS